MCHSIFYNYTNIVVLFHNLHNRDGFAIPDFGFTFTDSYLPEACTTWHRYINYSISEHKDSRLKLSKQINRQKSKKSKQIIGRFLKKIQTNNYRKWPSSLLPHQFPHHIYGIGKGAFLGGDRQYIFAWCTAKRSFAKYITGVIIIVITLPVLNIQNFT